MKVKREGNSVVLEGNIKTIGDFQAIKQILDEMILDTTTINIILLDSISITSSVIGYLTKLVHKDKMNISLSIENKELVSLMDDLGLTDLLHVRSIK